MSRRAGAVSGMAGDPGPALPEHGSGAGPASTVGFPDELLYRRVLRRKGRDAVRAIYMARWSVEHPGKLVICDQAGNEVDTLAIAPGGDRPAPGLFVGTAWNPYPGPDWDEDRPGRWTRAVYRDNQ